ncbi:MAG: DUF1549 domain-containing protein, partial [Gemmataceae bacterium]|nr:DUF1549 domain-containing protein [Gemmataceae bacterium]
MKPTKVSWSMFGLAAVLVLSRPGVAAPGDEAAAEFFERSVRPILAEHCLRCHGPKKQEAGLRLDTAAGLRKGSDRGPVVVPGRPEESRLVLAVRHEGGVAMPADGPKLPAEAIAALTEWVRRGAPWGAASPAPAGVSLLDLAQSHWAFQPVRKPAVPRVGRPEWIRNPVDAFVLAELDKRGLKPAAPADRRTLLRRLSFDLIGLPPSVAEIEEALRDDSEVWYEKAVDRLLASPHYGERWGRHWLDVARYADTKGYVFMEERRYPYAYTYRDYVIQAFNDDLPYDQFIVHQLAADRLPLGDDPRPLAAMGFLTLGRRFLNNKHDIIDDRLDVIGRGLLGLTITCARCHDHKFDPIPIQDYYSLHGVFDSSVEPTELPLLVRPEESAEYRAFEKELRVRQDRLNKFLQEQHAEVQARFRRQTADYLLAVRDAHRLPGEEEYVALTANDLHPQVIRRWDAYLGQSQKRHDPIFAPWHEFASLPQKEFASRAAAIAARVFANADRSKPIHPLVARAFAEPPASLRDVAERYGALFR